MKLQKMNNKQFFITLPNAIINAKGWIKGDKIRVLLDQKGDIILKKDSIELLKELQQIQSILHLHHPSMRHHVP